MKILNPKRFNSYVEVYRARDDRARKNRKTVDGEKQRSREAEQITLLQNRQHHSGYDMVLLFLVACGRRVMIAAI
jgi:hypothetical protein